MLTSIAGTEAELLGLEDIIDGSFMVLVDHDSGVLVGYLVTLY